MDYLMLLPHEIEELINEYESVHNYRLPLDYKLFLKYHNYSCLRVKHFYLRRNNRRQKRTCTNIRFLTLDKTALFPSLWNFKIRGTRHLTTDSELKRLNREYIIFAITFNREMFGLNKKTNEIVFFDTYQPYLHAETIADSFKTFITT